MTALRNRTLVGDLRKLAQPKYGMLYPLIGLLIVFLVFPTIYAWYLSFHRVYLATYDSPEFFGVMNFWNVIRDSKFQYSLFYTLEFMTIATSVELIFGLLLAVFFNRRIAGRRMWISLLLLPMLVSPALIGIMYRLMLNEFVGTIAYYLSDIKLLSSSWVGFTVLAIEVLQWTPFTFLILFAALQAVPQQLYEAASIDGAGVVRRLTSITIPSIMPMIIIAALFRGIDAFKTFDMIYVLTAGGPGIRTSTLSIYIYKLAFQEGNLGKATAASLLVLIIFSFPMVFILKRAIRKEG
jgi:multiple sugar transport system permease protein